MIKNVKPRKRRNDPNYIELLFSCDEQSDLINFSDEAEDFFPGDGLGINTIKGVEAETSVNLAPSKENSNNNWIFWPFWNKFGPIADIMNTYEEAYKVDNIQNRIWDINLDNTKKTKRNQKIF